MTAVTSLSIRSVDRFEGDRSKFSIRLQSPIVFREAWLEYAAIGNSFYNFSSKTVTVNDGAGLNAVLDGCYSATSLAVALQTAWAGYVVSFNADLQRFVISHGAPFSLTLPDLETARRMGYDTISKLSVANVIMSDRPPDLQRYKNLFVNIRELSMGGISSSPNSIGYTFVVPIMSNRGENVFFESGREFSQPILRSEAPIRMANFEVLLTGDDGQIVLESQINDWCFSLRIQ